MDSETIQKINKLNQRFYKLTAEPFARTRQVPWLGWFELFERILRLKSQSKLKVLDLGCGNGRFAEFLYDQGVYFEYTGIDSSQDLLQKAEISLQEKSITSELLQFDLMTDEWVIDLEGNYDLIVLFGVMHHLPDIVLRKKILTTCRDLLSQQGILVFTVWQFHKSSHLQKRVVYPPKNGNLKQSYEQLSNKLNFDLNKLGEGDYILDWQKEVTAYRYCHNYSEQEVVSLCQDSELRTIDSFEADGKEGNINKYFVCKRQV